MPAGLLGKKLGMTRLFTPEGALIPVTVIEAGPCVVVQRKTAERDGYEAIQVGYGERPRRRTNSPLTGHFEHHGVSPKRYLKEFPVAPGEEFAEQQELTVEAFSAGQLVDIIAKSKGRGFQGVMRRHGFHGGPASHGSKVHRVPMSSGATDAARVFPGQGMPGRMGGTQVTARAVKIVRVDAERNLLLIKGGVPGPEGGLVAVRPTMKTPKRKG